MNQLLPTLYFVIREIPKATGTGVSWYYEIFDRYRDYCYCFPKIAILLTFHAIFFSRNSKIAFVKRLLEFII